MDNIWIKKIELNNFQKHEKLAIDLTPYVNVIYGESGVGKSCIIRAIRWICYNDIKGDVVRKEGTKTTSVKITLSTGAMVERIKTASINAYIISKEGMKDERFDSINKTIPEAVKKVLQLSTFDVEKKSLILNIANQLTLPFLMNESGTFRSKLFNKMTGNDITDKVFGSLNKNILQSKRTIKSEGEHLTEKETIIEDVEKEKDSINKSYEEYLALYTSLIEFEKEYEKLRNLHTQLNETNTIISEEKESIKNIKIIDINIVKELYEYNNELNDIKIIFRDLNLVDEELLDIKKELKNYKVPDIDILEDLHNYNNRLNELKTISRNLTLANEEILELKDELDTCNVPDMDLTKLREITLQLNKIEKISKELQEISATINNANNEIKNYEKDIEDYNLELKELLKKSNICIRCKGTGYEPSEE